MKQQYLRLFSFLIGLSFIVSGVLFTFVNNYKKDKKEQLDKEIKIAEEIDKVYKEFFDKEKELSLFRDELIDDITNFSQYFQQMPDDYDGILEKVGEYEDKLIDIEDKSSYLKDVCNRRYSISDANDLCDAYYINLEKSINFFVGDVEFFNSKIEEYNEWIITENESLITFTKYEELDKYSVKKYKDYVDLNDDTTYLGKKNK